MRIWTWHTYCWTRDKLWNNGQHSMQHTMKTSMVPTPGQFSELGQMAAQLMDRLHDRRRDEDPFSWALLARILNFAAEAEQQLGEQQRRIAELEAISTTDELTGLANRRGLEVFLNRTLAAAQRHSEEGVLVFIDLDHFKSVNDTYGHDVGDAALKTVAETLKGMVRSSDMVARLGGDEFVAVLVRCPAVLAPDRAAKLEAALTKIRVRHGRRIIPVSASCGFAVFGPGSSTGELLSRADRMMYEKKMRKHADCD